jgi:Na+/proline symporter
MSGTTVPVTSAEETCDSPFKNNHLSAGDYVVFVLVLAISVAIGLFYWLKDRKSQTAENFLMADRQMSFLPVTLSLLASFMSAITLLGNASFIMLISQT